MLKRNLVGLFIGAILVLSLSLSACLDNKKRESDDLFLDYQINAREGDENLSVLLMFRDPSTGDAFELKPPSEARLDNELLKPDSTFKKNYYYELYKSIDSFSGKHAIIFTDINKKSFKQEFEFQRFYLTTPIPDTISRDSLTVEFTGVLPDDHISLIITDTAFSNNDINRTFPQGVKKIILDSGDLDNLSTGPVQLEFVRETRFPIRSTRIKGLFELNYNLKREVYLK